MSRDSLLLPQEHKRREEHKVGDKIDRVHESKQHDGTEALTGTTSWLDAWIHERLVLLPQCAQHVAHI